MTAPLKSTAAPITVLFVDDEPAILRFVVRVLQGAPFEAIVAQSAEDALAQMRERAVDVLVSDIDMPGMTGIELVKLVCRDFPSTLRILLTGAGTMDRVIEAINDGEVHRFFTKPFDLELFLATMTSLASRIERLRRDRDLDAHKAHRDAFYQWVEEAFPGTLEMNRNEQREYVIDPPAEDLRLLDERSPRRIRDHG
ncbi:MAG: response regulator [Minicystis sp.]